MKEPRPYQGESDLAAMRQLLVDGRNAHNGTYYIHTGDLSWWLYYPPLNGDFWQHIYLWDDPSKPGRLLGWALLSPDGVGIDVYIQHELRGGTAAWEMYAWAEQKAETTAREIGKPTIDMLWVLNNDEVLDDYLRQRGFKQGQSLVHLEISLDGEVQAVQLPAGYKVRSCKGLPDVEIRARAQYGSFGSTAPFDRYLERFDNFMRSPVYNSDFDIVVEDSDGQFGAFCIVWPDPLTRVGLFEPVGTHPDFQRRGLGKAVMLEGLRRLQGCGMRSAIVSTEENNPAAIKLYESVGFEVVGHLGTYEKDV